MEAIEEASVGVLKLIWVVDVVEKRYRCSGTRAPYAEQACKHGTTYFRNSNIALPYGDKCQLALCSHASSAGSRQTINRKSQVPQGIHRGKV
jgi:hypothetical protein